MPTHIGEKAAFEPLMPLIAMPHFSHHADAIASPRIVAEEFRCKLIIYRCCILYLSFNSPPILISSLFHYSIANIYDEFHF